MVGGNEEWRKDASKVGKGEFTDGDQRTEGGDIIEWRAGD